VTPTKIDQPILGALFGLAGPSAVAGFAAGFCAAAAAAQCAMTLHKADSRFLAAAEGSAAPVQRASRLALTCGPTQPPELLRCLGSGSFGAVYHGRDVSPSKRLDCCPAVFGSCMRLTAALTTLMHRRRLG
jgi:hypothetical protein